MPSKNEIEPLISGTLVLMSAVQHPRACVQLPAKIASNLARLAVHPQLSAEFRMVLERLRQHWAARCDVCVHQPPGEALRPAAHTLH